MRIHVIGCWGGSPRAGGACSGYLVEDGATRVLLDCGSGVASSVQRVCPLTDLDHVVVSHYHYDHVSDAGALMYARLVNRIIGACDRDLVFHAIPDTPEYERLSMEGSSIAQPIREGDALSIGGLSITFHQTAHPVPCLAMRVESSTGASVGYTADGACTPELADFMRGVSVLVSECSLYPGMDGSAMGHMSCDDVVRLARESEAGSLVVSHLPIYGDVATMGTWIRERVNPSCEIHMGYDLVSLDGGIEVRGR